MTNHGDPEPGFSPVPATRTPRPSIRSLLTRGLTSRCPRCGGGEIFTRWNSLSVQCPVCGFALKRREGDCWFFMYMTTGFFTGLMIAVMFLIMPANILLGQILVGSVGLALIVATLPVRKSLALALDFSLEEQKRGWLLYEEQREV